MFIGTLLPLYHSFILGCFAAYPLWHCSHLLCFATKNEKSNTLVPLPHLRKSAIKGIVYEIAIVSISDLLSDWQASAGFIEKWFKKPSLANKKEWNKQLKH